MNFALQEGIINLQDIEKQIEMKKNQEYLKQHPYKIYQGNDGKWYTYLPDDEKGRVQRKRNTKKEIEDIVIQYQKEKEENPTISEVFTEWNDRRLAMKKISAATHLRNQQIFDRHYKDFGKRKIGSVSEEEFGDFLEEQI